MNHTKLYRNGLVSVMTNSDKGRYVMTVRVHVWLSTLQSNVRVQIQWTNTVPEAKEAQYKMFWKIWDQRPQMSSRVLAWAALRCSRI